MRNLLRQFFLFPVDAVRLALDWCRLAWIRFRRRFFRRTVACPFCRDADVGYVSKSGRSCYRAGKYANEWMARGLCSELVRSEYGDAPYQCNLKRATQGPAGNFFRAGLAVFVAGAVTAGALQVHMNFFPRAVRKVRTVLFGPPLPAGLAADPTMRELQIRLLKLRGSDESNPELAAMYEQQGDRHAEEGTHGLARLEYAIAAHLQRDNPELWHKLGKTYLMLGVPASAQEAFNNQLERDPESVTARQGLALVHALYGRNDQALEHALEVESLDSGNVNALLELLMLYTQRRDIEAADEIAVAVLERAGDNPRTLSAVAEAILRFGQPSQAEGYFRQALEADPDHLPSLIGLGQVLVRQGKGQEAADLVDDILRVDPGSIQARALAIEIDRVRYGPVAAIRRLEQLQTEAPDAAWIPVRLGELHLMAGDFDGAYQASVPLATAADPKTSWDGRWLQSRMFFAQGLYKKALEIGRPLIEQNPMSLDARLLVAQSMILRDEYSSAVSLLNETIRRFPTMHEPYLRLCEALVLMGDPERAEAVIAQIAEQQEGKMAGLKLKGDYYLLSAKRLDLARTAYEEAMTLAPDNRGLRYDYIHLLAEQGIDLAKAEAMAQESVRTYPGDPTMIDALGWVRFHQGRVEDALPLLEQAVEGAPGIAVFRHHLAAALARQGKWQDAQRHLRVALALKPSFYGSDNARALLREAEEQLGPAAGDEGRG